MIALLLFLMDEFLIDLWIWKELGHNNKPNHQCHSEGAVTARLVVLLTADKLEAGPRAVWPGAPDGRHPATVAVAGRLKHDVVAEAVEGAGALPAGAPVTSASGGWTADLCETTQKGPSWTCRSRHPEITLATAVDFRTRTASTSRHDLVCCRERDGAHPTAQTQSTSTCGGWAC